jgi:single-stranded-DNA-specific exonuclease
MKFRWSPAPEQPLLCTQMARQFNIPALLAQCLLNRRLEDPQLITGFLEPRLKGLCDPFLLPNMEVAVERLYRARAQSELVVIFGDYDVDGVTATAILFEFLCANGWRAEYYLPNRQDEGYGLTLDSAERCLKKSPAQVLLAVDCGSSAVESVQLLANQGVTVIVLDHHQVSDPAPPAFALINPLVGCASNPGQTAPEGEAIRSVPFKELCSAGLAFKLAHALVKRGKQTAVPGVSEFDLRSLLDLVALGTIADLVPLTGENRILVSAGLNRLNRTERPGLVALKRVARTATPLGVYEVGFQLAPRINAAGRLETAEDSLRLLLSTTLDEAMRWAQMLDEHNRERQKLERSIAEQVIGVVQSKFNPEQDYVIVEGDALWHIGVVGIVASRVLHRFHRPTVIVGGDGLEWRGSGRSIAGFDLAGALRECSDILVRHGGHAMAAGLALQPVKLAEFRARLNEVARRCLSLEALSPVLRLDSEVGLADMTLECLNHLDRLNPTGQGNPAVHFYSTNLTHQRPLQRLGNDKQHVKMWVTDGRATREAIWWGGGNESLPVGRYDLAFTPHLNDFNGRKLLQLKVLDWRPARI